jgi:prepilin signal peptidase PulO-like enzyme (type II secretory pathway)
MLAEIIIFYIGTFLLGSIFGSFACCQAWRIHEKCAGKKLGQRSICMHCHHQLTWYDNIPLLSWLSLRGKCRYCKAKIGFSEILSELGLGLTFLVFIYKFTSPYLQSGSLISLLSLPTSTLAQLVILLVAFIIFWILLIYDAKWGELPVALMIAAIILATIYQFLNTPNWLQVLFSTSFLAGIYYLLYFFSKEQLVGGGDWILCLSIGIMLGHFELAIVELFFSNFAASIAGIPQIITGKRHPIPFGPFLILAMIAILITSDYLLKFLIFY